MPAPCAALSPLSVATPSPRASSAAMAPESHLPGIPCALFAWCTPSHPCGRARPSSFACTSRTCHDAGDNCTGSASRTPARCCAHSPCGQPGKTGPSLPGRIHHRSLHPFPSPIAQLLLIQTGELRWRKSTMPCCSTTLGIWWPALLAQMSSPASSSTSSMPTAHLNATKLVGFSRVSLSGQASTLMRLSARWSSLLLCAWFCPLPSRQWPVHQLVVKNAFLHGVLTETVEDSSRPGLVCRLNKSLYSLKQAWYNRFATFLLQLGFVESKAGLFVLRGGSDTAYLLLYVDDIVLTASSMALLQRIISALPKEFSMKDLGELHHFLGMHIQRCSDGFLLTQH